jgi:hypothetical protein
MSTLHLCICEWTWTECLTKTNHDSLIWDLIEWQDTLRGFKFNSTNIKQKKKQREIYD